MTGQKFFIDGDTPMNATFRFAASFVIAAQFPGLSSAGDFCPSGVTAWYAGSAVKDLFGSADAACSKVDVGALGYPALTFSRALVRADGLGATCLYKNGQGQEFDPQIVGAALVCTQLRQPKQAGPVCLASQFPVAFSSGNKFLSETDLDVSGMSFRRFYSGVNADPIYKAMIAKNAARAPFGLGWAFAFSQRLHFNSGGFDRIWAVRDSGASYKFERDANGNWMADRDVLATLQEERSPTGVVTGYIYVDYAGRKLERYGVSGQLIDVTSADGTRHTTHYENELLSKVEDQNGRAFGLAFGPAQQATKLIAPNGTAVDYSFNSLGMLESVLYADGYRKIYGYGENEYLPPSPRYFDATNLMTSIREQDGASPPQLFSTYKYNSQGRVSEETIVGIAAKELFSFDAWNGSYSTIVTDVSGISRTYKFRRVLDVDRLEALNQPAGSGCAASASSLTYDTNGNVTSRTDFAKRKVCYANDLTRNLETARIEGYPDTDTCPTDVSAATPSATQRKVSTQWHPFWRLETRRAEPKLITTSVYNGQPDPTNGNAIASCAPAEAKLPDGQVIAVLCKKVEQATTDETGAAGFGATASGSARVWSYTYNQYGQVLTANGPRTDAPGGKDDATTYTYYADTVFDAAGVGHTKGDLATQTNALGHLTSYGKYDKNGRLLEKTDADGVKTTQTWHVRGWLTSVTRSVGALSEKTTYEYDKVGQLKKAIEPDGSWVAYTYDAAHRLTDVSDSRGNTVRYTLDAMGNRTAEDWKDTGGNLRRAITRSYDALNRLQSVTGAAQ